MTAVGGETLRAAVATALWQVVGEGRPLEASLAALRADAGAARRSAFIQECVYGVTRHYFELDDGLRSLLERPLRRRDGPLKMLLLLALYELRNMDTPAHAVVHESVAASVTLGRGWAKSLVNAVLREAIRRQSGPVPVTASEEVRWNHPSWMIAELRHAWPGEWTTILAANNARAPLTLRVNRTRGTRVDYLNRLRDTGIAAAASEFSPDGVQLAKPQSTATLPGYAEGLVSVQDEGAQLAAGLLDCADGHRVLDACAAPGGKSLHLLERHPGIDLTAMDVSAARLRELATNLLRLGLTCTVRVGDARDSAAQHTGSRYDRILLDAPCSALGVIRRHPDIKVHRTHADVAGATRRQGELLQSLWRNLAPGGRLLYSTCSVLPCENDEVIAKFLENHAAAVEPIRAEWGRATTYGRQILPGEHGMDGFFYAVLLRPAGETGT